MTNVSPLQRISSHALTNVSLDDSWMVAGMFSTDDIRRRSVKGDDSPAGCPSDRQHGVGQLSHAARQAKPESLTGARTAKWRVFAVPVSDEGERIFTRGLPADSYSSDRLDRQPFADRPTTSRPPMSRRSSAPCASAATVLA